MSEPSDDEWARHVVEQSAVNLFSRLAGDEPNPALWEALSEIDAIRRAAHHNHFAPEDMAMSDFAEKLAVIARDNLIPPDDYQHIFDPDRAMMRPDEHAQWQGIYEDAEALQALTLGLNGMTPDDPPFRTTVIQLNRVLGDAGDTVQHAVVIEDSMIELPADPARQEYLESVSHILDHATAQVVAGMEAAEIAREHDAYPAARDEFANDNNADSPAGVAIADLFPEGTMPHLELGHITEGMASETTHESEPGMER